MAKSYHEEVCTDGECIVYERKANNRNFYIGPSIGFNALSIISAKGKEENYLTGVDFGYDQFVSGGLMLKMNFGNTRERLFAVYNIEFYNAYHSIFYEHYDNYSAHYYNQTITISQQVVSSSLALKYEHPFKAFRSNFGLGLFHAHSYKLSFHNPPFYRINNDTYLNHVILSPNRFGVQTSIGFVKTVYENIDLEINFQYQFGMGLYTNLNTHHFAVNLAIPLLINAISK